MRHYPLLFLFITFISCSEKSKKIDFQTKAYATLEIIKKESDQDSISASISHVSILPDDYFNADYVLNQKSNFIYLPLDRPSKATVNINGLSQNIWVGPNDTLTIHLSSSGDLNFSGKYIKENQYFRNKRETIGLTDIFEPMNQMVGSLKTYDECKIAVDSLSKIELEFLQNYQGEIPNSFRDAEEMQISYDAALYKASFPLYNQAMNIIKSPMPDDFYSFVNDLKLNNTSAIPIDSYFSFLTNYFWRDIDQNKLKSLRGKKRVLYLKNHLVDKAIEELRTEIKDYFLAHHITDLIKYYNKIELDSIAKEWNINSSKKLITEIIDQKALSNEVYQVESKVEDFEMYKSNGNKVKISDFKEKIVYLNFWATWCKPCIANIPQLNSTIKDYQKEENIVFINLAVESDREKWIESIKKYNIEGLNLFIPEENKYEQIRAKFGITGVPHYVILGKDNILKVNYANKAPKVKSELDTILEANN